MLSLPFPSLSKNRFSDNAIITFHTCFLNAQFLIFTFSKQHTDVYFSLNNKKTKIIPFSCVRYFVMKISPPSRKWCVFKSSVKHLNGTDIWKKNNNYIYYVFISWISYHNLIVNKFNCFNIRIEVYVGTYENA